MPETSPTVELAKEQPEEPQDPKYSEEESLYLKGLKKRLESARDDRDRPHEELNNMSYLDHYAMEERLANTFIKPKKNKEDTNFQSGTIRQKIFALLAPIVNLNLTGDISAFDDQGLAVQGVGDAMEDIHLKTNELDKDDEKKLLREYELLKHGTVFVEELWDKRKKYVKKMGKPFDGKIKKTWEGRLKDAFARPTRNIVRGPNVYLGDITAYDISDQPYIFTVDVKPYDEAKLMFGDWERWEFVSKRIREFDQTSGGGTSASTQDWRLLDKKDDYVEIIRFQDKWNNEFAVILNGVLMTPVGLPLPWGYEDYNIAQQNLEPISPHFAYGKSLVSRIKDKTALLDEMMRLSVLKTQKSFMPPYLNISGRVISNRVFMPGKISHGIAPNSLVPISEHEAKGVTQSEFNMIAAIEESINSETVSPVFQGQQAEGNPTATEIIELQRQAKLQLGLTIHAVSMLEWKLEWLRLQNLLANWFSPDGDATDQARDFLKSRQVSVEKMIDGEGMGQSIVIPTNSIPSSRAIQQAEDALSEETGTPTRLTFINPEVVTSSKLSWQIVVRPKERKTSETEKLMFRAFMQDAAIFGPKLNIDQLAEEFATIWGKDPTKLFLGQEEQMIAQLQTLGGAGQPGQAPQQAGNNAVSPRVNLPQPEQALNQELRTGLRQ